MRGGIRWSRLVPQTRHQIIINMKRLFLLLFSALTAFNSFAQSTGCSACNEALKIIQNTTIKNSNTTNNEALSTMFKYDYSYWEKYKSNSSYNTEAEAGFSIFSASFGTNSSSSEAREKYETLRNEYQLNRNLSNSAYQYLFQNTTDPKNLNTWLQCMINTCGEGPFIESTTITDVDFIVNLGWRIKNAANNSRATITVVPVNCRLVNGDLRSGQTFSPSIPRVGGFQKTDKNKSASVSITVTGYATPYTVNVPAATQNTVKPVVLINSNIPPGTVVAYAGNDIPDGWLICDGRPINSSQYAALYNAIGTIWGAGNSRAGEFNLPDFRGLFLRGLDSNRGLDPSRKMGTRQDDALQDHAHKSYKFKNNNDGGNRPVGESGGKSSIYETDWAGQMVGEINPEGKPKSKVANETRPVNQAVFYIIKY